MASKARCDGELKRREKLYDFYGKHLFLMEISPILTVIPICVIQYLSSLFFREYTSALFWVWFGFIFVSTCFYNFVFGKAVRREKYPLQILTYVKLKSRIIYPFAAFVYFLIILSPLYKPFLSDTTPILIVSLFGLPFTLYIMFSFMRRISRRSSSTLTESDTGGH